MNIRIMVPDIIRLMRPHQWVKNLFILLPLFFAGQFTDIKLLSSAILAMVVFSLSASALYIINDFTDIEEDRAHPTKRNRPLASGAITKQSAVLLCLILFGLSGTLMALYLRQIAIIIAAYIAMNIAYSLYLKRIAILDVTIIAIGFVLRLFVGSVQTEVPLSMWIVVMTFLLALFIALAKRRDDVLLFITTGEKARKVIDGYNVQFLEGAMMVMASVVIVAYILYTTSIDIIQRLQTENLYFTAIFVILGIMRYLQIAIVEQSSGSPTRIVLKDTFIQLTILGWMLSFVWILYL